MDFKEYKEHCSSFIGVNEDFPFEEEENLLAFKVMDEIFALADSDNFSQINLKCDPVKASTLRTLYEEVQPGTHTENKRHWNAIDPQGTLDDEIIKEWINASYDLVVDALPRKKQRKLKKMRKKAEDE